MEMDMSSQHANAPYYFVPQYMEFVGALPYTPTNKVQKFKLREEGVTDKAWVLKESGYKVKRWYLSSDLSLITQEASITSELTVRANVGYLIVGERQQNYLQYMTEDDVLGNFTRLPIANFWHPGVIENNQVTGFTFQGELYSRD